MSDVFTDLFASYAPGEANVSGMVAAGWTLSDSGNRLIVGAFGYGGSQGLSLFGAAIDRDVGSHDRYGSVRGRGKRAIPAPYDEDDGIPARGLGIQVYDAAGGYSGYFGFANDPVGDQFPGAGVYGPDDLIFFAHTQNLAFEDVDVYRVVSNAYVDGTFQDLLLEFRLSSRTPTWINQDGCVRLTIDGVVKLNATGIYLASRGDWDTPPDDPQAWTQVYYTATGYLDNVVVTDNAFSCGSSSPTEPTLPTPIVPSSQPCCTTTSQNQSPGAGPLPVAASPVWTPSCLGGGLVPSAADLTDSERWDF